MASLAKIKFVYDVFMHGNVVFSCIKRDCFRMREIFPERELYIPRRPNASVRWAKLSEDIILILGNVSTHTLNKKEEIQFREVNSLFFSLLHSSFLLLALGFDEWCL